MAIALKNNPHPLCSGRGKGERNEFVRRLFGKARFERFGLGFVTGFAEQCEHILLISFDTGLVERVDVEEQTNSQPHARSKK